MRRLFMAFIVMFISCSPKGIDSYERAEAFRKIGEYEKAIVEYKAAIESNPANAQFYSGLALVYEIHGDLDNALERYEHASKLSPENKHYLSKYNLVKGMLLLSSRNYEEAVPFLVKTTDSKKDSLLSEIKTYYVELARNECSAGRYGDSERALRIALYPVFQNIGISNDNLFYLLSEICDKQGDNVGRIRNLRMAISQNPRKKLYHYDLGKLCLSAKDYRVAMWEFEEAGDYKDASRLHNLCKQRIEEEKQKEAERRQIWRELIKAEDRAMKESRRIYPDLDPLDPGYSQSAYLERFQEQEALRTKLYKKYKNELAEKYGLTQKQLDEIGMEAIEKDWPLPPY